MPIVKTAMGVKHFPYTKKGTLMAEMAKKMKKKKKK